MVTVSDSQKRALLIATAIAVIFGAYFLKHYLLLIISAAIIALICNPFYQWRLKRGSDPSRAAMATFLVSVLALIIPISIVGAITAQQVINLASTITDIGKDTDLHVWAQDTVNSVNNTLASTGIPYQLELPKLIDAASDGLKKFGSALASGALSSISGIGAFFASIIIYFYVFLSLLKHQNRLLDAVHNLNPLGRDIGTLYINKASAMTKAMVRGQFVIAACQGLAGAALIYLAGIHDAFFFFFVVLTALSIIPLGGGILALPIGAVMLFMGNIWQGLLIIVGHLVIVTNIDNVLRPRLVPREARLDPALTLLAVFSGLSFFGFLGIVIGPVLMILIVTTIQVFLEVHRGGTPVDTATSSKRSKQSSKSTMLNALRPKKRQAKST